MSLLRRVSLLAKLIATLGLLATAQGVAALVWGADTKGLPVSILPTNLVHLGGQITITDERLILLIGSIVLAIALRFVYSRTLFGLATGSVAESRLVTSTSGWSPSRIELANFALGGLLSATAAIFLAPIVGLDETTLALLVLPALAAALLGRFSSFAITVVGALLIGVVTAELSLFGPNIASDLHVSVGSLTGLPQVAPLLIILLVTVVSGSSRLQRGEANTKLPLPGSGQIRRVPFALAVAVALILAFTLNANWSDAIVASCAGGVLVLSVVLLTGYAGQLSLAQFSLAGFGAWVAARLVATEGVPFELAIIIGIVATIPVGLLVALPALRTRGVNFAVATLALSVMISALILQNDSLSGGFTGTVVKPPTIFGLHIDAVSHPARYAAFAVILFALTALVVASVRRGPTGRRLLAVRANERAAAGLGISVYNAKLFAFALSSAIAALAGIIIAFENTNVEFEQFDTFGSINVVLNSVLGGLGFVSGSAVGALQQSGGITSLILDDLFTSPNISAWILLMTGAGVVLILKQAPDGLAAYYAQLIRSYIPQRNRPQHVQSPIPSKELVPATLDVRNVTVTFGGVTALSQLDLSVRPGEVLGLMGPNGAGKTTLIDVMTGFTKPTSGAVKLNDLPITTWSPERRARAGISRSWQAVELFEEMTIRDNLLAAIDDHRKMRYLSDLIHPGRSVTSVTMNEAVEVMSLGSHLDERPSSLSQGTARLAGVARAMVTEPSVFLLDEPAAGLTAAEGDKLGAVVRRLAHERGVAVIIIEHDVAFLSKVCDRLAVLDFGQKIAEGTPSEVMNNPAVVQAYLGAAQADEKPAVGEPEVGSVPAAPQRTEVTTPSVAETARLFAEPGVAVLKASGLCAGYGQTSVVRDVDLVIHAGEVVALLGPNGVGKTTTVLTLAGELPRLGGTVEFLGDPTDMPLCARARLGLGLVAEQRTVLMTMTVEENLRVNRGDISYALRLLPELQDHLRRRVGLLSGGQQQMLALARALSRRPKVLLADELSLGLGPLVVSRLLEVIRAAADDGLGVLLVEQHVHKALAIADRAYVLGRGGVAMSGDAATIGSRLDEVQGFYLADEVRDTPVG
jgi:ABC-type branched-subunit amino acid transport system ATPase component/ABC-type branched-subunit amino acid transport system permease subunit